MPKCNLLPLAPANRYFVLRYFVLRLGCWISHGTPLNMYAKISLSFILSFLQVGTTAWALVSFPIHSTLSEFHYMLPVVRSERNPSTGWIQFVLCYPLILTHPPWSFVRNIDSTSLPLARLTLITPYSALYLNSRPWHESPLVEAEVNRGLLGVCFTMLHPLFPSDERKQINERKLDAKSEKPTHASSYTYMRL